MRIQSDDGVAEFFGQACKFVNEEDILYNPQDAEERYPSRIEEFLE